MNEIEQAIALLEKQQEHAMGERIYLYGVAIKALRKKAERDRGCGYCKDESYPALIWQYGLDHALPDFRFCPMCGRRLEDKKDG